MKTLKFCFIYAVIALTFFNCKKENGSEPLIADAERLLTEKPWKLLTYGYDNDKDGRVSKREELIRDCEKDNISVFKPDGTGVVTENETICPGGEKVSQFTWALTENGTVLDFTSGAAYVKQLSENNLIITDTVSSPALTVIYGH